MVRMITQVLAGLMLLFGAATLFPKAYFEYRNRRGKSALYFVLGLLSLFFSIMAFVYAYLILSREILI
ncbi:MAG: DUF308 domain-containing protein [Nitrospiraceae bacterium]|nr:DUF308 domain-containing protein [Nitrospiraceae bacterium]